MGECNEVGERAYCRGFVVALEPGSSPEQANALLDVMLAQNGVQIVERIGVDEPGGKVDDEELSGEVCARIRQTEHDF